jgi:hypothetical protein
MFTTFENTEDKKQLDFYDEIATQMLSMIRKHIHQIYTDESLTANNRTILKNFYLEHFATPAARAVYESYFPKKLRSLVQLPSDPADEVQ